jgi:hypothetical protein
MAQSISQIADKVACGGGISANTGKLGCLSLFGTPDNLLAIKRGTKLAGSSIFNLATINTLVKAGTIIPLIGASSFEDVSAEDGYSTNTSGVKRLNLKGLPEYKFMYEEGHEFYRQLDKLEGYKSFDYIIGDDEGNWMLAVNADGTYSGFSAGHTTPALTKRKVPGGEAESKSVMIQFLERGQFDRDYAILHQQQLDFNPWDVPCVNGVNLTFTSVPIAGTTLNVTAKLAQDNSTPVEGIVQFTFDLNGVTTTVVPVAGPNAGTYVLTVPAMVSTDDIGVYIGTASNRVVEITSILYRSNDLTDEV